MVNGYALRRLYFYDSNQRGSKQWVVGVAGVVLVVARGIREGCGSYTENPTK